MKISIYKNSGWQERRSQLRISLITLLLMFVMTVTGNTDITSVSDKLISSDNEVHEVVNINFMDSDQHGIPQQSIQIEDQSEFDRIQSLVWDVITRIVGSHNAWRERRGYGGGIPMILPNIANYTSTGRKKGTVPGPDRNIISWLGQILGAGDKSLGDFLRDYQWECVYDVVFVFFKWISLFYLGMLMP